MISMISAAQRDPQSRKGLVFDAPRKSVEPAATVNAYRHLTTFELADRLVEAWSRNQRRLESLDAIDAGIASARRHLASPGGRQVGVARTRLALLSARRQACAAEAEADRRLAEALVREWESRHRFDSPTGRAAGF